MVSGFLTCLFQTFSIADYKDGHFDFKNVFCDQVFVSSVSSSQKELSLAFQLEGIGIRCTAELTAAGVKFFGVEIIIDPTSSFAGTLTLSGSPLPSQAALEDITSNVVIQSMKVGPVHLPDWILKATKGIPNDIARSRLEKIVSVNGTNLVRLITNLATLQTPGPKPPPNPAPSNSVNVSSSMISSLSSVLGHAEVLVQRLGESLSSLSLNALNVKPIPLFFPNICSWIVPVSISTSSLKNFLLTTGAVSDLEAQVNVSALLLNMTALAKVWFHTPFGPDIGLQVGLSLVAEEALLSNRLWISLSQSFLSNALYVSQVVSNSSCALNDAGVEQIYLAFRSGIIKLFLVADESVLQQEVFDLINNANLLFESGYGTHIAQMLSNLLAQYGPDALNALIEQELNNVTNAGERLAGCMELDAVYSSRDLFEYDENYPPDYIALAVMLGVFSLTAPLCWILTLCCVKDPRSQTQKVLVFLGIGFLLGSLCMYAAAAFCSQAWVWAVLETPGNVSLATSTLKVFTFANLVTDSWNSRAYINAIGLVALGLMLPIVRALLLLIYVCTSYWRGNGVSNMRMGMPLETMTKLGGFVSTEGALAKIAFTIIIPLVGSTVVRAYLYPSAGFYFFLAGNVSGIVGGEVGLWSIRASCMLRELDGERRSIARQLGWSYGFSAVLGTLLVLGGVITTLGLVIPSVQFTMGGAAAQVLPLVSETNPPPSVVRQFSIMGLAAILPAMIDKRFSMVGVWLGDVVFGILGVGLILVNALLLIVLPLVTRPNRFWLGVTEFARAASGAENWIVVLFASFLSINLLAEFIIGPHCGIVNQVLQSLPQVVPGATECFAMTASPLIGFYLLLLGTCLTLPASAVVIGSTVHVLYDMPPSRLMLWAERRGWMTCMKDRSYMLVN